MEWWALQDRDDPGPYAVIAVDDQGLVRRFVPGEGLVDWPGLAMFTRGEPGAYPISDQDARELIEVGVGELPDGVPVGQRGAAPTIPVG